MEVTSHSLLERIRTGADPRDWQRLIDLYQPWIHNWVRRHNLQEHDAADVTQEVLAAVAQELPSFHYDPARGRFRSWLRAITVNRLRAFWKSQARQPIGAGDDRVNEMVEQLADPDSDLSRQWDREHDVYIVRRALALIKTEFKPKTWRVFHDVVLDGRPVDDVAAELGLTRNAVYIAQSRVTARLRQELQGLCDY